MANILTSNKSFEVDDIDTLLRVREEHSHLAFNTARLTSQDQPKTKARRSATLEDFIEMVSTIVTKATKERNIIFEPNEGVRPRVDQSVSIEKPHIYYKVISRKLCNELKPREREETYEEDIDGKKRLGRVWGQKFECLIQFDIMATDYKAANNALHTFEDLMFNYTSYFKRNGIAEILFHEQLTDHDYDLYRQSMSVRSIRYRVWVEKLHVAFDTGELSGIITE